MELLKKISSKVVIGSKEKIRGMVAKGAIELYTVYGVATGVRSGESNFGAWESLIGNFEACRTDDGVMFGSSQCFLPDPVGGMVAGQLNGGETSSVQFAVMIGAKPSDTAIGYEYTVTPLVEPAENDALSVLREKVSAQKALPAPAKEKSPSAPKKKSGKK